MFGHGAELALEEAFGGDVEGAVEAGAGILPSDDGGEFNELALGELPSQGGVEFVGNVGGCAGERGGEAEGEFFLIIEVGAGFELRDLVELLFGDSGFSADGRMNVDSKRTAPHHRGFELRQFFQVHRDSALGGGIEIKAGGVAEVFGIEGADAHAERNAAECAFGEEEKNACGETGVLSAFGTKHNGSSIRLMLRLNWRLCVQRSGRPQKAVPTKELETILGNDLFGFLVNESEGGVLGRHSNFEFCACDSFPKLVRNVRVRFVLKNAQNCAVEFD